MMFCGNILYENALTIPVHMMASFAMDNDINKEVTPVNVLLFNKIYSANDVKDFFKKISKQKTYPIFNGRNCGA